jgi:hypothetical protein
MTGFVVFFADFFTAGFGVFFAAFFAAGFGVFFAAFFAGVETARPTRRSNRERFGALLIDDLRGE